MSGQSKTDRKIPEQTMSIEERVDLLFEELAFAIQWQRPSILLVFYDSESVREMVELALKKRLAEIEQELVQFGVDEEHFDIPLLLSQRPERDRSVYSVTGLARGGGKGGANAYRALNMRREYFVDYSMRVITWLAGDESIELSRNAPDFWAFRHRVVEFHDSVDSVLPAISAHELSRGDQEITVEPEDLDGQIEQSEALIRGLPKQNESITVRLDLINKLAALYQAKEAYDQAIRRLKQGLVIAKQLNNPEQLAKLWGNLGSVYLDLGRLNSAVRACRKATRFSPQDASLWIELGHVYRKAQRFSDAIIAYKQACRLDPQNLSASSSMVACYRLMGKDNLAEQQRKIALPMMGTETEYNKAVFEAVSGNTSKAIGLLALALEKKQAGVSGMRREPNLDFIRDEPEYHNLLEKRYRIISKEN